MAGHTRQHGGARMVALALALAAAVAAVVLWAVARTRGEVGASRAADVSAAGDVRASASQARPVVPGAGAAADEPAADDAIAHGAIGAGADSAETLADPPDPAQAEYPVDLDRLRERMPDNLYWRLGAPTQDPDVLRARADEERAWNELFGKVQSSTATEDEVRRYYDHRRRLSEDYVALATAVLEEHGDRLPERDRGMYELSIELHTARLAELPRQIDEALDRVRRRARQRAQEQ